MRILVVNPPQSAISNLDRIKAEDVELFSCQKPEETIALIDKVSIDLVFVFLKLLDREALCTLLAIFGDHPDMKVIGLADAGTSDFISFLEQVDLTPVEAVAVE